MQTWMIVVAAVILLLPPVLMVVFNARDRADGRGRRTNRTWYRRTT